MDWQARESPTLTTLFNAPAFRSKSCFIAGSQMVELRKWRWGHRTGQMVAFLHPEIWGKFSSLLSLWINLQCWASDRYRLYSIADVISDLASYLKYLSIFLTLLLDICQFLECHGTSLCLISYLNGGWGFCRIKKKRSHTEASVEWEAVILLWRVFWVIQWHAGNKPLITQLVP